MRHAGRIEAAIPIPDGRTMRSLIPLGSLLMCLQACGGDTSVALHFHWGDCDFDRERWSHADRTGRGCMLASLLDRHPPESMSAAQLTQMLGPPTGYAGDDEDLAYVVAPAAAPSGGRMDEQLLVFRTDPRTGRVVRAELLRGP
jgi:hypothetical protein